MLAISKITTEHESLALTYIALRVPSHFNITKLFNDHILFQGYAPFQFVCLLYIGQSSFTFLLHEH